MNNEYGKYLPLGTIVLLKGGNKKLMITGFCLVSQKDGKPILYDYSGIPYPEGMMKIDQIGLFNHEQIEKVFYLGFRDQEQADFMKFLNDFMNMQSAIAAKNLVGSNEQQKDV